MYTFVKDELLYMTRVPDRNRTHDLLNTGQVLYPPSYQNSWRARSFYWVHMWQASCILLGSALLNSPGVVISEWRWWILSSVIKCKGWIIQHDTSMGQRNIRVPNRNRTHDLPNTGRALYPLSYENSWRTRWFNWVLIWHASPVYCRIQQWTCGK